MTFDWSDYLQLAKQLSGSGDEAARRSAVSRAYYSAFHAASLSLTSNKVTTDPKYSRDRHLRVWNIYIVSSNKTCRSIGNKGQRLKLERQDADYDATSGFPDLRIQRCISQAQDLLSRISVNVPEGFSPSGSGLRSAISYLRRLF